MGKSERREIASQLTRLLLHLLKWQYQPEPRSDSWLDSITDARTQIELAIEDSRSLKTIPQSNLKKVINVRVLTLPSKLGYQFQRFQGSVHIL